MVLDKLAARLRAVARAAWAGELGPLGAEELGYTARLVGEHTRQSRARSTRLAGAMRRRRQGPGRRRAHDEA